MVKADILIRGVKLYHCDKKYDIAIRDSQFVSVEKSQSSTYIDADQILDLTGMNVELWPSYVETHAHLALSTALKRPRDPARILALQYLLCGITRVLDLFGFPTISDEWQKEQTESTIPFPEVTHCGHLLTAGKDTEGLHGHGKEYCPHVTSYEINVEQDIRSALENNISQGARFTKVMFTSGQDMPGDKCKFTILRSELLQKILETSKNYELTAIVDCNSFAETNTAYQLGYRHFAHMVRDRILKNSEWDMLSEAEFTSTTLASLFPMVMEKNSFLSMFHNHYFLESQSHLHLAEMQEIEVPYGIQYGIQNSRQTALDYMRKNAKQGLARNQVFPGSDSGNTYAFHGYGLHSEFIYIAPDNTDEKYRLIEAATVRAHQYFEKITGTTEKVEIVPQGRADFNLFTKSPCHEGSTIPWKTFLRGKEIPRDKIVEELKSYHNDKDYFKNQAIL
jgi:hypothetical protein